MASHLSDDELRQKLIELGEDVGPIDVTTRYLWENKYTNLLKGKKKKAAASRNSINSSNSKSSNRNAVKNKRFTVLNEFSSDENTSEPEMEPKTRYQLHKSQEKPAKTRYSVRTATMPTNSSTNSTTANNLPEEDVNNDMFFYKRSGRPSIIPLSPYSFNRKLEMDYENDNHEASFRTSSPIRASNPSYTNFFDGTTLTNNSQTFVPNETARNRVVSQSKPKKIAAVSDFKLCPQFKLIDTVSNSHYISMLLPILAALFFVFIGVIYMSSSQVTINPDSLNLSIPICHHDLQANTPAFPDYSCIEKGYLNETLEFSRELYTILSQAAGNHQCGYRSEALMLESELKKELEAKYKDMPSLHFFRTFMYSLLLIRENEALQIKFFYTQPSKGRLYDIEKLEALNPTKSFWCRCTMALNSALVQILAGVLVVSAIVAVYLIVNYRLRKQKQATKTIYLLVDQIIDLLKENFEKSLTDTNVKPFVAVSHVRDMLIPLAQRKSLLSYWEKAVELIETQESRIKVEHKDIAGERYRVWRWLQNTNLLKGDGKIWQGQAFGSSPQGLNFLSFCPTDFLKIRNMFESQIEAGTEWTDAVKDAILEKCEGNKGIVHIHVDTSSLEGCVYVKCLDSESTYKAYRALHGWWYDGKLVTVKFLRPERYHSKFPESENCRTHLKPSNSFRRSLSTSYTSSLLESS